MKFKPTCFLLLHVFFLMLFSCKQPPQELQKFKLQGPALGTTYGITYIAQDPVLKKEAMDSLLQAVNQSMSTYWANSDITKINKGDTTIVVGPMFKEVYQYSNTIFEVTGGYFDPTVGPLVNAWGFGPSKAALNMSATKVDSLMQYVGYNKVSLLESGKIVKQTPGVYLDFNAIAKGYTLDRIGAILNQLQVSNYLIELGGELLAKGQNTLAKKQWLVGIDHPKNKDRTQPIVLVQLENSALASSGNYRKFRLDTKTGEKYVHTINPLTGYTENSTTLAASVLAPNCTLADGYATAFMAMGYKKAKALAAQLKEVEVFLVYINQDGQMAQYMSDGFKAVVFNKTQ